MDLGVGVDVEQFTYVSFHLSEKEKRKAYANNIFIAEKCDLPPPRHLPLKTHPRLRPDHPLRPPHRNIPIHPFHSLKPALVGSAMCQRSAHGLPGYVGLSVARTPAY